MKDEKLVEKIINQQYQKKSAYWSRIRSLKMLNLFHEVAARVPAYKDFLKLHKVDPNKIKTITDFSLIPIVDKKNYIQHYPLSALCWDGTLDGQMVLTATSGSTGEPSYFLRNMTLDWQYSIQIQKFLQESQENKPILAIVCFGMGIWIGGLITYKAIEIAANRKKLPLSIITPGINKKEIISALKKLSPQYGSTILIGYPPFLKDIVDESSMEGVDLKKLGIRFIFAAEAITEELRTYLSLKSGIKNAFENFMNVYGSADIGAMAFEDRTSIFIKKLAMSNIKVFADFFSSPNKTPTLAQFNPNFINFETNSGEILITGNSAIPLVRYSIGDSGGVISFSDIESKFKRHGVNLYDEWNHNQPSTKLSQLPFVYIYERLDFSTNLYGITIYPEWIKKAIVSSRLNRYYTGKFTLLTSFDKNHNQYLEVNLELRKGVKPPKLIIQSTVHFLVKNLIRNSSEYRELASHLKEKAYPKVKVWESENETFFKPGIKQKWVKKIQ